MFNVYVFRSVKDKRKYSGFTNDLIRRMHKHNSGKCKATRNRTLLELIYSESFETRGETAKREKFFKTRKGQEYIKNALNL